MTKVWKVAGVWLLIAAVVWLFTVWRWQTTDVAVSDRDIVLQLLVLPVLLTASLVGALWGLRHVRAAASSQPAAPAAQAVRSPGATEGAVGSDEALREAQAWLLASAVVLPVGNRPDAAWSALCGQPPRPGLDPHLLDHDGLPVFTSRATWVDEALSEDDGAPAPGGHVPPVRVQRAWQLMQPVLAQLLDEVVLAGPEAPSASLAAAPLSEEPVSMKAHLAGVAAPVSAQQRMAHEAGRPSLTVRLVLPSAWTVEDQAWFVQAVRHASGALLDWAEQTGCRALEWHTTPPETPEALWDEVDQVLVHWQRTAAPALMLVLTVDSALDDDAIERMQSRGELFTAQHQAGLVPGEAAAGLLLACPHWPLPAAGDVPAVRLGRPLLARRAKSADAAGRASIDTLRALLDGAAARRVGGATVVGAVVTDADHRGSRAAELYESVQLSLPDLDPATQVIRVGESCGDLGAARAVAPIALAHTALHFAEPDATATLAVLMQDGHERVVVPLSRPRSDGPGDGPAADQPTPVSNAA